MGQGFRRGGPAKPPLSAETRDVPTTAGASALGRWLARLSTGLGLRPTARSGATRSMPRTGRPLQNQTPKAERRTMAVRSVLRQRSPTSATSHLQPHGIDFVSRVAGALVKTLNGIGRAGLGQAVDEPTVRVRPACLNTTLPHPEWQGRRRAPLSDRRQ
jgi:hypothetical protein